MQGQTADLDWSVVPVPPGLVGPAEGPEATSPQGLCEAKVAEVVVQIYEVDGGFSLQLYQCAFEAGFERRFEVAGDGLHARSAAMEALALALRGALAAISAGEGAWLVSETTQPVPRPSTTSPPELPAQQLASKTDRSEAPVAGDGGLPAGARTPRPGLTVASGARGALLGPVGTLGVFGRLAWAPVPWFELDLSALYGATGQFTASDLRIGIRRHGVDVGAGFSRRVAGLVSWSLHAVGGVAFVQRTTIQTDTAQEPTADRLTALPVVGLRTALYVHMLQSADVELLVGLEAGAHLWVKAYRLRAPATAEQPLGLARSLGVLEPSLSLWVGLGI